MASFEWAVTSLKFAKADFGDLIGTTYRLLREIMFEKYAELMNSPKGKLATKLALEDYNLIIGLIEHRLSSGLTQNDVATYMGISQQAVAKFESLENDPRLSSIRKYAVAVNALVTHKVQKPRSN